MDIKKLNNLGEKALEILPSSMPLKEEEIKFVEKKLNIEFPSDFKILSEFVSYEFFHAFSFLNFRQEGPESIIYNTLNMYNYMQYKTSSIILYEDTVGIIIMKNITFQNSEIYWSAIEDVENILEGIKPNYDYKFFPTFADFFEYLLDEEEKIRAEEIKSS